ncbi:DNA-binding protein [Faecalispora anaeroviscerum]|nr:DNA-binding protein [Faecalispora anaeroviscerum]
MDYMTAKETAEKWTITPRRVLFGLGLIGRYLRDVMKPKDGRYKDINK